ncbi:hypothetical protein J2X55_000642 [Microbacterium sp. 1154]|uniref:hypothetical protein n=1 Tax=Microbacterium sp. 1154 TaxID=2817733 RepID=UPI000E396559|nr:hypothetical protein [Microbacterium sp. 1154]MDR6689743.1 hypothetical protein [Microbacterium sp. 1154]
MTLSPVAAVAPSVRRRRRVRERRSSVHNMPLAVRGRGVFWTLDGTRTGDAS